MFIDGKVLRSPLSVCLFYCSDDLAQTLVQHLQGDSSAKKSCNRYVLKAFSSSTDLLRYIQQDNPHVDCLVLQSGTDLQPLFDELRHHALLLPAVIVQTGATAATESDTESVTAHSFAYHAAALSLPESQLDQIGQVIAQAIRQFIQMGPMLVPESPKSIVELTDAAGVPTPLMVQQLRLAEKLKERLGYLGVYYKRNSQNFFRHMTEPQKEDLLRQLKAEYREIILSYFTEDSRLNDQIDNFVNIAFFADVSVSQIVEIHMDLMDEFAKQLKLEGRNEEILLDYRLTLIDIIAHLCEMYRRSIPREA